MAARDISRSRKAYSYYRPRPRYVLMTSEEEMTVINQAISNVALLNTKVVALQNVSNNIIWNETPSGLVNGVNVSFNLSQTPIGTNVLVFINGVLQERDVDGADYSINGKIITFKSAPRVDSKILVTYAVLG